MCHTELIWVGHRTPFNRLRVTIHLLKLFFKLNWQGFSSINMVGLMRRHILFLFFIFNICFAFAQKDEIKSHGTIKISKPKPDSVYIKAEMNFQQFQEGNKKVSQQNIIQPGDVTHPVPIVSGYSNPFDYNLFSNRNIQINSADLENKIADTIRIQIKILDHGRAYYKDVTPLITMAGVAAYYDERMNAYKLDAIHLQCMNVLKQIKFWEPAYMTVGVEDTLKKINVIRPKKIKLAATGIFTIIFSKIPFED